MKRRSRRHRKGFNMTKTKNNLESAVGIEATAGILERGIDRRGFPNAFSGLERG
jgi:hypothetical protein